MIAPTPAFTRPWGVVPLFALRVRIAFAWSVVPPIGLVPVATALISVVLADDPAVISPVVRQLIRSSLISLSAPLEVGRELH